MTSLRATSRVFDAARKMKVRLKAQSWPSNPFTGLPPQVALADGDPGEHAEIIQIVPDIGDDASITWRSMPNGRDEVFDIVIAVTTLTHSDEDQLLDRLEELADVIQRAFYDDTELVPGDAMKPLDIANAVKLEGVGQVSFYIDRAGDEGLVGGVAVRYRLHFRI